MRYLCDSDFLIDFLNEVDVAVSIVTPLLDEGLGVSLVAVGEVYDGVLWGRDPVEAERRFLAVLERTSLVGLDLATMRIFAELRGRLRATGRTTRRETGDNDLMIAATALRHDLTLVTRNRRHFDRIPGLRLNDIETPPV